jgi:hypothetical protein
MAPLGPRETLLSQQVALAQLAGALKDLRHLEKFVKGVGKWLESPSAANRVQPKELNRCWAERVTNGKGKAFRERERQRLVAEIKAFTFEPQAAEKEPQNG